MRPLLFACLVGLSAGVAQGVELIALGCEPEAVSADGSTVVGTCNSSNAFRWTSDGLVLLGDLPGGLERSSAHDVSADGSVVVGVGYSTDGREAFRWTESEGMTGLGDLPGGAFESYALAVSADASVIVGGSRAAEGYRAFRWTAADGMVELGATTSSATDVSADGAVVVGEGAGALALQAFRWTALGGVVGLGTVLGDPESRPTAVSEDGSVVVGLSGDGNTDLGQPFRWTAAQGMTGLGLLPGVQQGIGAAEGVTADGSVVVGWIYDHETTNRAFVWDTDHGMRTLEDVLADDYDFDVGDWTFWTIFDVTPDGRTLVGAGSNGSFVLRLRTTACDDGEDNDDDGLVDYPEDTGCRDADDPSETPDCGDGLDNDGDGLVDLDDPGCPFADAQPEDPRCDDGLDNDGDGFVDFDDPQCDPGWPYWEAPPRLGFCGLGFELVAAIPLVTWLHGRRRRRT